MMSQSESGMPDDKLTAPNPFRIDTNVLDPRIINLWSKRAEFLDAASAVAEAQLAEGVGHEYSIAMYALLTGAPVIYDETELSEITRRALNLANDWRAETQNHHTEPARCHPFSRASLRMLREP